MAKRKQSNRVTITEQVDEEKRNRLVTLTEPVVEKVRTGIYTASKIVGTSSRKITQKEAGEILQRQDGAPLRRLNRFIDHALHNARLVLKDVAKSATGDTPASGHELTDLDLGDGIQKYSLPVDQEDQVKESLAVLRLANEISANVNKIGVGPILDAVNFGILLERLAVRPFEPDAFRGRVVVEGAADGGRLRRVLDEADQKQASVDVQAKMRAGNSWTDACNQVAANFGVSYKTITRIYPNPNPKQKREALPARK